MMSPMDYELAGKVALVTGASSGIGRATTELLAQLGMRVVACDVDREAGEAVVAELGDDVHFMEADVTDEESGVRAVVAFTMATYGRLDCAANCAGVGGGHASTHDYPVEEFDRIVNVNLRGTWLSMRAELEIMSGQDSADAIVNVSSTLGLRGSPYGAPYSASKHGVLGLTRTAAIEYAPLGVRVNAVCPGAIDTPMMDDTFARFPGFREMLTGWVPMGRMGAAGEVAGAIAWLSSEAASFVTGEALTVEGGLLAR
jgi:NAD(P)-dependent dehydrogenase (short-subunit alcohol dehydrogenase family)